MLEINKRYIRTSPDGEKTTVVINTEKELEYQNSFTEKNFTFKEIEVVEARGSVCFACEG